MTAPEVRDIRRFATRANGTAPIPASSGERVRHRLSPGGNRRLNWAIRLIALTQARIDRAPAPTSPAAAPKDAPAAKPSAPSNATSPSHLPPAGRRRPTTPGSRGLT